MNLLIYIKMDYIMIMDDAIFWVFWVDIFDDAFSVCHAHNRFVNFGFVLFLGCRAQNSKV